MNSSQQFVNYDFDTIENIVDNINKKKYFYEYKNYNNYDDLIKNKLNKFSDKNKIDRYPNTFYNTFSYNKENRFIETNEIGILILLFFLFIILIIIIIQFKTLNMYKNFEKQYIIIHKD